MPDDSSDGQAEDELGWLDTNKRAFKDQQGRTVILRGVNLSAKIPLNSPTHDPSHHLGQPSHPSTAGAISFVNTPLDLDDTTREWEVHVARLKGWGFNAVRLTVAWEAIEHEGPGKYDQAYLDYVVRLLRVLKEASLRVFIDPHQDCWSRATGGSGAPYWTLNACGLDPAKFQATQAALAHGSWKGKDGKSDEPWPAMIWQTNAFKLACSTAFTLFWAGRDFAPKALIDGKNIQDWLQEHYLGAFGALAKRIAEAGDLNDVCVMGWDSMNEPLHGYIEFEDLSKLSDKQSLKLGPTPTPLESFQLGLGRPVTIQNYRFGKLGSHKDGQAKVDPEGVSCWMSAEQEPEGVSPWGWKRDVSWQLGACLWEEHGVWNSRTSQILKPNYFTRRPHSGDGDSGGINFLQDYWVPHWKSFNATIRKYQPKAIAFVNPPVFEMPPQLDESDQGGRCCLAPHYYDGLTLLNKQLHAFNGDSVGLLRKNVDKIDIPKFGHASIRESVRQQLAVLTLGDTHPDKGYSSDAILSYPAVIGETGVPFDFTRKNTLFGLLANGDTDESYAAQTKALDQNLSGCEGGKCVGWFLWEYSCNNTHKLGDNWNGEDLSIICKDDWERDRYPDPRPNYGYDLLTVGCRAWAAYNRPYPESLVGIVEKLNFDIDTAEAELVVRQDLSENPSGRQEPESRIYLPFLHYAIEQPSKDEDGLTSKPPGHGFHARTLHFSPNRIAPHSQKHTVHLTGRPDPNPELGIKAWSPTQPTAPRIDINLSIHLKSGQPASGDHLEVEAKVIGQWLTLRWTGSGSADRVREYELGIERWTSRKSKPELRRSLKHPFGKWFPST